MRKDSRLSRMLHVLVHLHQVQQAVTSEQLALMLHTNPVVVRRTMALVLQRFGEVTLDKLALGFAQPQNMPDE